jgi:hypothetical protein
MVQVKGKILTVGHIINGKPENWKIDCEGMVAAINITANGQILYAGYSILELEKISKDFWGEANNAK